jgi:hypothetical protein
MQDFVSPLKKKVVGNLVVMARVEMEITWPNPTESEVDGRGNSVGTPARVELPVPDS